MYNHKEWNHKKKIQYIVVLGLLYYKWDLSYGSLVMGKELFPFSISKRFNHKPYCDSLRTEGIQAAKNRNEGIYITVSPH